MNARVIQITSILGACFGLTLASAFGYWTFALGPAELTDAVAGLGQYWPALPFALPAGIALAAALVFVADGDWAPRLSAASCFIYIGALAGFGWPQAPWFALVLIAAALFRLRAGPPPAGSATAVVHLMGTLSSFYVLFNLSRYQPEPDRALDALRGFWWLISL